MGNQTSQINPKFNQQLSDQVDIRSQLQSTGSRDHPYLRHIQLWKFDESSGQRPLLFSKVTHQSVSKTTNDYQQHQERVNIDHPNILNYYGCSYSYLAFSGNIQETILYYEYLPMSLQQIINHHKMHQSYVDEQVIWKIASNIISACAYLETVGKYHSDLCQQNIFVDGEQNFKILYNGAFADLISGYSKLLAGISRYANISPQQMLDFARSSHSPTDNQSKSEAFSLGMTLLQTISKQDHTTYYNFDQKIIYYNMIMEDLCKARQRYSQRLIQLIQRLLSYDEIQRPNLNQLVRDIVIEKTIRRDRYTDYLLGSTKYPTQAAQPWAQQCVSPQTYAYQSRIPQIPQQLPQNTRMLSTNIYQSPVFTSNVRYLSPQVLQSRLINVSNATYNPLSPYNSYNPYCSQFPQMKTSKSVQTQTQLSTPFGVTPVKFPCPKQTPLTTAARKR